MSNAARNPILPLLLAGGSLALPATLLAQGVRTLPETRVTADSGKGGAGLAASTLSSDDLDRLQVTSLEDLSLLAPNLHFVNSDSGGYGNILTMRGQGNTLFFGAPTVGLYVDDVPFSDAFSYPSELLRLDSATVHYGPQGSAFGRNAPGGLIELTTMQPGKEERAGFRAEYGSHNSWGYSSYSSGPIVDGVSMSTQFYYRERDGFVTNALLGRETDDRSVLGGLATIVFNPSPDMEIKLRIAAEDVNDGSQRLTALPTNPNPLAITNDPFRVNSNVPGENNIERFQISLHGRKDFDWGTMKSITSYQEWDLGPQTVDLDLGPSPFLGFSTESNSRIEQDQRLWTQEFRFESAEDGGPLSWRGGFFYSTKDGRGRAARRFPVFPPVSPVPVDVREVTTFTLEEETFAAFLGGAYELGGGLSLEAGGRVESVDSSIRRSKRQTTSGFPTGAGALSASADAVYFSPTGGLVYQVDDNLSVFARTGLGIKPHGFSAFSGSSNPVRPPTNPAFGEERNWSKEIGIQFTDPDANLNAVLRAFWNDIDDYQVNVQDFASTDFSVVNAPEVTARGIEAELSWRPIDELLLHGSVGWTDTEFDSFTDSVSAFTPAVVDGMKVPFVPEFTASGGARYDLGGGFFVSSTVRIAGETYYDTANTTPNMEKGYSVVGAEIGYESEKWALTLFGSNVFDENYYTFINPQIAAGTPGDPAIFGVRVDLDLW